MFILKERLTDKFIVYFSFRKKGDVNQNDEHVYEGITNIFFCLQKTVHIRQLFTRYTEEPILDKLTVRWGGVKII